MKAIAAATAGALTALVPVIAMWGFTVDDALISVRYAQNLASHAGWRFDALAPPTDGVTPLPWVPLLVPLASGDPLDVLVRAKVVGVVAWTSAATALGVALARRTTPVAAALALAVIALAFPIAAWAASGMETGVVTALCTFAAITVEARPRLAAALAGLAAAFRPELLPWALVVGFAARPSLASGAFALGPFVACVVVRLVAFASPTPLAVHAKPSDLSHGATYAVAALVVVLTPLLAASPLAVAREGSRTARVLAVACIVHAIAVGAAGGDWMPYARLVVPIAPSLVLVFADVARAKSTRPIVSYGRAALAAALGVVFLATAAPAGRRVQHDREALVRAARPVLADAKVIAALDIGWVSAAAPPSARIVDLAGLTDPSIAALPGGHTSKRIDVPMILDRNVDTVVVYSDARVVEARLTRTALFAERFTKTTTIPLGDRGASYDVFTSSVRARPQSR